MKLLAPGVGWAEWGGRFYWTSDNGANWKDITPPARSDLDEHISDFYFLDSQRGWALFSRFNKNESDEFKYEEPKLDLASTTDAGATWTRTHLTLPPPANYGNPDLMPLAGWGGTIAFLDPLHGWMNITLSQTHGPLYSFLLVTSDGGRTWSRSPNAPRLATDDMLLVTPNDGWMIGTSVFSDKELFVTHDGTKSWQQVLVDTPKEVLPATMARYYQLPTFEDSKHGLLLVYYSGGVGVKPATVLFATGDSGRTWKPDRMVTNQDDVSSKYSTSTVVDSDWIFAAVSDHRPVLTRLGVGRKIDASADAAPDASHYKEALQVSFATPTQGWVIVGDGDLMSTADGGATWTTLTPGPQPHVIQPHGSFVPRQSMRSSTAAAPPADPPSANDSSGQNVSPR
ncbi:MAG TPA: sialidase family protein [Candidatus Binatus sp.]|uniref:sialidase family protein n=1 Tax=Candidatus Binatus sp. TaxID=2811406 RepID=UPI002F42F4FD